MVSFSQVILVLVAVISLRYSHLFERQHQLDENRSNHFDSKRFFRNKQGLLVHHAQLGSTPEKVRGVVIVVHGYGEHFVSSFLFFSFFLVFFLSFFFFRCDEETCDYCFFLLFSLLMFC